VLPHNGPSHKKKRSIGAREKGLRDKPEGDKGVRGKSTKRDRGACCSRGSGQGQNPSRGWGWRAKIGPVFFVKKGAFMSDTAERKLSSGSEEKTVTHRSGT